MAPQILAGKYQIQEEIARGGMGVIYKALDRTLNRIIAIKQIHAHLSGDLSFTHRFLREARAMARLQHENIVEIYAIEEEQKTQFLVMEFCPGSNLRAIMRQAQLPVREAIHISRQLASALAYAHAQGIIHRDIKPANMLFDKRGKAKLTDFGIAAALDEAALTSVGQVIGTPEYMAPEQARGLKLDGRADLYSLGIVMYEMLTGKTPYSESPGTAILGKLAYDREELALQFPTHVPSLVQGVVRDLLRRDPADRIPDAETLANQLHEIMFTLPQILPFAATDESQPTIVSRQSHPPAEEPTRHISQSTVIAPSQESSLNRPASAVDREAAPAKNNAIVSLDRSSSERKRQDPISSPLPTPIASSPARPLGLIIAIGTLVGGLTIIGLISFFGSQTERSSPESAPSETRAPLEPSPDRTSKDAVLPRTSMTAPTSPVVMAKPNPQPMQAVPVQKTDAPAPKDVLPAASPNHIATTFPDAALRSLLDQFTRAYEGRDMDTLGSISTMDAARRRYVEEMFRTYKTLKLSLSNITREENGAAAVFLIDSAVTTAGETVDLTPIARKITLHVSRKGDNWDKIVW
ncbi:MAG TPA: protein kinase [Nitrospira sp.]|nr:protein kinase [Nitrospira sp.]